MMMRALVLATLLVAAPAAWADCPAEQVPAIIATGGMIDVCVPEDMTSVDVEVDGNVQKIPGPFAAGVQVPLVGVTACSDVTMRIRGVNAAGAGRWSDNVAVTFPPCGVPVLVGVP